MVQTLSAPWQDLCAAKQSTLATRIPSEWRLKPSASTDLKNVMAIPTSCGILSAREVEITELDDVQELLRRLAKGMWSSEEVTVAFCKRAAIAHQLTNCLSEFWFEDAIARARQLDEIRVESGPVGPLHGLPISLKDQFQVEGKECNIGWASWIGRISTENSALVDCLLKAGAVIYTRTNIAQGLWIPEGNNHVYGRVDNPFNRDRTSGGSSSGEGPLGILKGSPLGVGTDIGGSVRIPASYNNLFGLRPTTRRFPYAGALNTLMGQENVESCLGPMSTNLGGCVAFSRAVLEGEPWKADSSVVPLAWRESEYLLTDIGGLQDAKLTIGYYDFDGVVNVHPTVKRAMRTMLSALQAAGHHVIPWTPTGHAEAGDLLLRIFDADGGDDLRDVVGKTGETILPQVIVGKSKSISVFESYKLNRAKAVYRNEMLKQWLSTAQDAPTGRPIDAILCPVAPYAAPPHGCSKYIGYTGVYNLLDWPALAIPVTVVDPELDPVDAGYEATDEMDQSCKDLWDPIAAAGLPVGLQLVGQRFQEERLLGVAEVVIAAYVGGGHSFKV